MNDRMGTLFGQYRLDALIGRGGMGEVYRAYDTVRDRYVALKLLGGTGADDGTFAERFRRECQLVARLGEPHIIPIHDCGEIDGTLYLDMRLVEGENLRQLLLRSGALAPERAVDIVEQVGSALDAAHAAGLVHRDVKPENILVTPDGFAYLVDFGIAYDGVDSGLTRAGTVIGSTAYLAPEQFDDAPVSPASDVYALSAVLYELLTGRPPFPGDTVSVMPPALGPVVSCGLAKDPAQRYRTARDLGIAARQALSGQAATAFVGAPTMVQTAGPVTQYPGPVYRQAPPEKSMNGTQLVLLGLIGLLVAALIGVGVYYLGFRDSGSDSAAPRTTTLTSTVPPTADATAQAGGSPSGATVCGEGVAAGSAVTSCPFAIEVRRAYLAAGPMGQARTVRAFSPVTGDSYAMTCVVESSAVVTCRGGSNAVVHIY